MDLSRSCVVQTPLVFEGERRLAVAYAIAAQVSLFDSACDHSRHVRVDMRAVCPFFEFHAIPLIMLANQCFPLTPLSARDIP